MREGDESAQRESNEMREGDEQESENHEREGGRESANKVFFSFYFNKNW